MINNLELMLDNELRRLDGIRVELENRVLYNIRHGLKNEEKDLTAIYATCVAIESLERAKKGG